MSNKKYPNGYWPKIEYWSGKLQEAVNNKDLPGITVAQNKLEYFINRQAESVPCS